MSEELNVKESTGRHQLMSRWHSPNSRQLCRDRLLSRLKQNHEMRSSLVDSMRKININDLNDTNDDNNINEDIVDEELQQIISTEVDMKSFTEQEIHQLAQEVKQDFLEEQNKSWEGLQTKEDQLKSQKFLNALESRRALMCPYCKSCEMQTNDRYLVCISCGIRFETHLSIQQIIDKIYQILNYHSMSQCRDRFPQFNMFKSNLVIYCDTCPLNQFIL